MVTAEYIFSKLSISLNSLSKHMTRQTIQYNARRKSPRQFAVRVLDLVLHQSLTDNKTSFSLKAILPLQVLNFLVVASGFGHAYIPNRPCTTMVCTGCEWRNNWRPGISQGNCVNQHCTQHCSYKTIHGNFSCPPPVPCFP